MTDSDDDKQYEHHVKTQKESASRREKILMSENGQLRKRLIAYADKYDYLGGKTLLQEANKWKHKYQRLLKIHKKADTRKKAKLLEENAEIQTELSYYKSKFFDLEYKYQQLIRDEIGFSDYKEKMINRFDKLSTDNINLKNQIEHYKELLCSDNSCDSYGYGSMEECIKDMVSDNPEYPFTEKEKEKIINDNKKLEQKEKEQEEVMKENNHKLKGVEVIEEVIEDKEDLYQYTGYTQLLEENLNEEGDIINMNMDFLLNNKLFKKRIMGSIRKKHKELYKKHKVIVKLVNVDTEYDDKYCKNKIKYTYELELKDKKIKL